MPGPEERTNKGDIVVGTCFRVCPEEGDQDSERRRGQDLGGVAEVTWVVQLGEKAAEGQPHGSLQHPQGVQWRGRC